MKNERDKNGITILLYETDGLLTEFDANIISSGADGERGQNYVELDRTAFFPEGGGQKADTGFLVTADGHKYPVTDVQTVEGRVRHYTDILPDTGMQVHGMIDASIRFARMQNHGAEHLVSGLIHSGFGYDNVGFHMSDEGLIIDVNGPLTGDQLADIEKRANLAVFENVPITVSFPSGEEAAEIEYRSKLEIGDNIRLVTIEGYDVCACCAPHLDCTGRFGVIKIKDFMPHRGGTRITMIAGMDAYSDYVMLHEDNSKIMNLFSAGREHTAEYAQDFMKRYELLREENSDLKRCITDIETHNVLEHIRSREADDASCEVIFSKQKDQVGLRNLVNGCTKAFGGIVCAFMQDEGSYRYIFAVCGQNAKEAGLKKFAEDFNQNCLGRGGGSDIMVQGSTAATRADIERFLLKCSDSPKNVDKLS